VNVCNGLITYCGKLFVKHIANETAICRNPHNSSDWQTRQARQPGYKRTFCQNVPTKYCFDFNLPLRCWWDLRPSGILRRVISQKGVDLKILLVLIFRKNIIPVSVDLLKIGQDFSAARKIVCGWVMKNCSVKGIVSSRRNVNIRIEIRILTMIVFVLWHNVSFGNKIVFWDF
jgi:hypothetical protein